MALHDFQAIDWDLVKQHIPFLSLAVKEGGGKTPMFTRVIEFAIMAAFVYGAISTDLSWIKDNIKELKVSMQQQREETNTALQQLRNEVWQTRDKK